MNMQQKLSDRIDEYYKGKGARYAPSGNRASSIGHPCLRNLVYSRTRWNEAAPLSRGTLEIFEEGNDQERLVNEWLLNIGFRLHNTDQSFPPNEWQLTGHIDGLLTDTETGEQVPVDIKSNHPNIYPAVNTVDDLGKKFWMKKWYYQFQAYLFLLDMPVFWILMKNKSMKQIKPIIIERDEKIIDEIKQKCKSINGHIENEMLPDKINDVSECERCVYSHLCLPEIKRDAVQIAEDVEFLSMLERRAELEELMKEYKAVDKSIKEIAKNTDGDKFICGNFYLEKSERNRSGYTVKPSTYTVVNIMRVDQKKD